MLLAVSLLTGAVFGLAVPALLRAIGNPRQDATVAFALAVILLVAISYARRAVAGASSTLAFGLVARHRRVAFSQAQRNFGALGELLTVLLFVFVASTLDWQQVAAGSALAHRAGAGAPGHQDRAAWPRSRTCRGISWRKGALTGVALAPMSVFVDPAARARAPGAACTWSSSCASLAAVTMLLEVFGPIIIQRALVWAREAPETQPETQPCRLNRSPSPRR